jgi:glycosyltransferase involved in cell wall biosynthesis
VEWLDKRSISRSRALLVNGDYIGGVIENIYAKETVDVPAGSHVYPLDELQPNLAFRGSIKIGKKTIKKPYALITNRHDPQKRFDYVIRALKKVAKVYPKAKLVIPGPFTEHTPTLVKLAKRLGIENKVYFLGQISEKELQEIYKHCAVYCYPSPEEDFGLGPLEAGGWGVPTVAWNHAGPTVTVEDGVTGFLAEPYDVSDYADKMLKLFKDEKLREKMGLAAWTRTKNVFSWDSHVDALEKSIRQFI